MDSERYDLHFGSLKVGVVTTSDSDFPNLWGTVTFDPALSKPQAPEAARFARFVALNQESMRLVDTEHARDNSREQAVVNAELAAGYMGYVESEEWRLVDARGQELSILCPIFREAGEIVWRWNPDRV
jgi:hypothetical protein